MSYFDSKVCVVTGAASGIGRAIARFLGDAGSVVVLVDQDSGGAARVAREITDAGGRARAFEADVSRLEAIESVISETIESTGSVDILINNAGISANGEFMDIPEAHWEKVFAVNFQGVTNGCRAVFPVMQKQGSGQIVNTASLAGLIPGGLTSCYSASKHAVVGFSQTLRAEAEQYGIKVNTLCPGYVRTGIQASTPTFTSYMNSESNQARERKTAGLSAEDIVDQIMRGVRKNRSVIVAPRRHRIYWLLYRLFPPLIPAMFRMIIRKLKSEAG